jgi:ATP-dependent exoDNAse (exonuclease V) beta subunit
VAGEEDETEAPAKERTGRFGPLFGEVVHEAIGRALRDRSLAPDAAARLAARDFGLTEHLDEAAADVARAIGALRRAGLLRPPGPDLRLEYPVAGEGDGGTLLRGYVDLLSASARGMDLIDFKTDPPPRGPVAEAYPAYVEQVRIYDRLLAGRLPAGGRIRCGLLFTADGSLHWLP